MGAVGQIGLLGAGFVISHVLLSHPPVRQRVVDAVGLWPFRGIYSVVSAAFLVPQILIWWTNRHAGEVLWVARGPVAVHAAELIIAVGFGLVLGGAAQPPPASMANANKPPVARGMAAITRHPIFMGLGLWAVGHVIVNGWVGDLLFYGTWLATTLFGCWHQDYRLRKEREGYSAYMREVPFLPVPRLRALKRVGARAWIGFVLGLGAAVGLRLFHAQLFS